MILAESKLNPGQVLQVEEIVQHSPGSNFVTVKGKGWLKRVFNLAEGELTETTPGEIKALLNAYHAQQEVGAGQ